MSVEQEPQVFSNHGALQLLEHLLSAGRLSTREAHILGCAIRQEVCRDTIMRGNVTISRRHDERELTAMYRVLNTNELLQHILLCLEPTELLLRSQLVCKGFKILIDHSPRVRRHMFRNPDPLSAVKVLPYRLPGWWIFDRKKPGRRSFSCRFDLRDGTIFGKYARAGARNLLLVQPPVKRFEVRVTMMPGGHLRIIETESGPTFGELIDALRSVVLKERYCFKGLLMIVLTEIDEK